MFDITEVLESDIEKNLKKWGIDLKRLRSSKDGKGKFRPFEKAIEDANEWFSVRKNDKGYLVTFKIIDFNDFTTSRFNELVLKLIDYLSLKYYFKVDLVSGSKPIINKLSFEKMKLWQFNLIKIEPKRTYRKGIQKFQKFNSKSISTDNIYEMIKFRDLLPSKFRKKIKVFDKKEIVKSDTWTHATWSEDLINQLLSGKPLIGKKENLKDFNVPKVSPFRTLVNVHAPNFKKGDIFPGFEINKYLITTDLDNNAFQPNWNSVNYDNFENSANVGVLRPEYREAKNFKLWERVPLEVKGKTITKWGYAPIIKPVEKQ